jgi:hypothetical protein
LVLSEKRKKKEKSSRDWQAQMSSLTEGGDEKQVVFLFPTKTKNSSLGILFLRTKYLYLSNRFGALSRGKYFHKNIILA